MFKFFFSFLLFFIAPHLNYGEPILPDAKTICPTCVKYAGSIKMMDVENNFNYVISTDYPDLSIVYRNFRSTPGIRAFYIIQDPMKPVPEPLIDVDLCSIHDTKKGLTPLYQLTTILASYILPVGLPCKKAMGKRPMPLNVSQSTYYLIREPTPCNHFNITVEIATLQTKLNPYLIMTFAVTKPGITCDSTIIPKVSTIPPINAKM